MREKSGTEKRPAEAVIKGIRRATRKHYGAEDKIRIVLEGLRGEESIAALCRREGIAECALKSLEINGTQLQHGRDMTWTEKRRS